MVPETFVCPVCSVFRTFRLSPSERGGTVATCPTCTLVLTFAGEPEERADWAWTCNECGSREFTPSVSEEDASAMGCSACGGDEFHRETPDGGTL